MNIMFKTPKGAEMLQKALEELKENGVYLALQVTNWDGGYPKYKNHNGEKHITVKYGLWNCSIEQLKNIVGEMPTTATVNTSGYADDGKNNGVFVNNPILNRLGVTNPHITLSWVEGSAPVHTGELTPTPFESGEKGWKARVGQTTMWRPNWIPQQITVKAVVYMKDKRFYELRDIIPKRERIPEEMEADSIERAEAQARREQAEAQKKAEAQAKAERKEQELQKLAQEAGLTLKEYTKLQNEFMETCNAPYLYDYGHDIVEIQIIKEKGFLFYKIFSFNNIDVYPIWEETFENNETLYNKVQLIAKTIEEENN